jgi:hypothetical protein
LERQTKAANLATCNCLDTQFVVDIEMLHSVSESRVSDEKKREENEKKI